MEEKSKCRYWNKCFRKDPGHRKEFLHPGDVKTTKSTKPTVSVDLLGKTIVFTGTLAGSTRKQAQARAAELGCRVTAAVSSKTDILVVGDEPGAGATYAKKIGIKFILSDEEWQSISGGSPSTSDPSPQPSTSTHDSKPSNSTLKLAKKRRKTHDMSDDDEEDETTDRPTLGRRHSQRLAGKPVADYDKPSPPKRAKLSAEGDATSTTAVTAASDRPKCRYWAKCYRKDPDHLKNFKHPPKTGSKTATSRGGGDEEEAMEVDEVVKCAPLHDMADGETADVMGGLHGNMTYTVKRTGDHYTCTCTAWKMQRAAVNVRTCKHLQTYLGEDYENQRTGFDPEERPVPSRTLKSKNVSVLLAHKWTEDVNPKGWWLSEKLDGVRAYWDGRRFYSRLGNEFLPPAWFIKGLPQDMELDGELFGGRGKFQSTVSVVKTPESSRWKDVKYCVFDAPSLRKEKFEARMKTVNDYFNTHEVPYAYVLAQEVCRGKDHMFEELERVEGLGGEGVMVRQPGSIYVGSRSHTLLKLKSFHDAEARVIGHEKGKGRNAAVCGALVCQMANGKQFKVGSGLSDKDRKNPPKKGSIITYRFQELTNSGSPRFPTYVGVRIDLDEPSDAVLPPKPSDS